MEFKEFNIKEGTIEFRVKKNKLGWNDGKKYLLVKLSSNEGEIRILKREDNRLLFSHHYYNKGMSGITYGVSNFSSENDYFIAATWSVEKGNIILYINGEKVAEREISYS